MTGKQYQIAYLQIVDNLVEAFGECESLVFAIVEIVSANWIDGCATSMVVECRVLHMVRRSRYQIQVQ